MLTSPPRTANPTLGFESLEEEVVLDSLPLTGTLPPWLAGSLLPTLFFGVPGSSGMAIMLGAFLMLGIQPGPTMLTEHINIVWSLIWPGAPSGGTAARPR